VEATFVTIVRKNIFCFDCLVENIFVWKKLTKESNNCQICSAAGILSMSDNPTNQLPNKFLFSQIFAFVDGKHHHLMEENIWLNVKKKLRQTIDSQVLLLFSLFHLLCFLKTSCFFHVICFLRTGCFFHVICFIKTGRFKCCLFWLLSILCFVVKNDLRQKIYFRFFNEIQYAASDVTFFPPFSPHMFHQNWLFFSRHMFPQSFFFMSYVSSKLVDSNVWCLVDSVVKQCHHF